MEFKVRELDGSEEKSLAEKEQEILDQHEAKEQVTEEVVEQKEEQQTEELTDEKVLKFLGSRYGREITSFDDLVTEKEANEIVIAFSSGGEGRWHYDKKQNKGRSEN